MPLFAVSSDRSFIMNWCLLFTVQFLLGQKDNRKCAACLCSHQTRQPIDNMRICSACLCLCHVRQPTHNQEG